MLQEILLPLAISIALVVMAVFLIQARRLATAALGLGLTIQDAAVIFFSALPPFLTLAIPIAYLLSVLVGLGRLASDLEIVALRALGVSPLRIARVPIVTGLLVGIAALPIGIFGEPYGLRALQQRLVDVGLKNLTRAIQPGIFNEDFQGSAIYARKATPSGQLGDVLLYDERNSDHPALLTAKSGAFHTSQSRAVLLELHDGEMHLGAEKKTENYDRIQFEHARLGLDAGQEIGRRTQFVSILGQMTMSDLKREIARLRTLDPQLSRRLEKTYWRRFAFPAMALVFGVAGAAIALAFAPRARASRVVLGLLAVLGYYLLTRLGDFIGAQYSGSAFLSAWGPNAVVLGVGVIALVTVGRPR